MMKAGLLALTALSVATVAQPHRHQHMHKKRDVDVVTQTDIVYATAPAAVVYVNADDDPLSTSYSGSAATTSATPSSTSISIAEFVATSSSAPSSSTTYSPSSSYVAPYSSYSTSFAASETSSAVAYSTSSPAASSTSLAAAATSSSSSSTANAGYSLVYSPYLANGDCKDQDAVNQDFESISGYTMIRTYGTDCNQTATILTAASAKGMKIMAGVYDLTAANLPSELSLIHDAATANGGWDNIDTVAVGNEAVNSGAYTVSEVLSALSTARSTLSSAGFTGKIVTVDTAVATIANPELCENSDYAAVNAHPFFDGGVTAQESGTWLLETVQRVSSVCGGKDTVVTETGWPWQGESNGKAVPSSQNQQDAMSAIKSTFANNVVLFTSFNDYWKTDSSSTFGAEKYWGFMGDAPSG